MTNFSTTEDFDKQLKKLDKSIAEKIVKKMVKVFEKPHLGKPLKNVLKNCWEERIEKYRILYIIDSEGHPIFFYIHDKEDNSNTPKAIKALFKLKEKFGFSFLFLIFNRNSTLVKKLGRIASLHFIKHPF